LVILKPPSGIPKATVVELLEASLANRGVAFLFVGQYDGGEWQTELKKNKKLKTAENMVHWMPTSSCSFYCSFYLFFYLFFLFVLFICSFYLFFLFVLFILFHADPIKNEVDFGHSYDLHSVLEIIKLEDGFTRTHTHIHTHTHIGGVTSLNPFDTTPDAFLGVTTGSGSHNFHHYDEAYSV
jgi:hypothetical protein